MFDEEVIEGVAEDFIDIAVVLRDAFNESIELLDECPDL